MFKPHTITLEKVDGLQLEGLTIEIQGAMTVRETTEPLEGVYQSSLFLTADQAAKLHGYLGQALQQLSTRGWRPNL